MVFQVQESDQIVNYIYILIFKYNIFIIASREMPNIIDYFYKSGSIKQPIFSLCYELNGGYMTIGGFNH